MKTFKRICIKDFRAEEYGKVFELKRGKEYITSGVGEAPSIVNTERRKGYVVVYSNYWVHVPIEYFSGEVPL
jgi:hypothetical protein